MNTLLKKSIMGKHLFLIRHAESSHPSGVRDFDRPLSETGYEEANKMSMKLRYYDVQPELFISSPAKRALNTAMIFAEAFHVAINQIQPENMIYGASVETLLAITNHLPEQYDRIALFGHNPGLTDFAEYLTGEYLGNIPTAGIVHITFDEDRWEHISVSSGTLIWKATPKSH